MEELITLESVPGTKLEKITYIVNKYPNWKVPPSIKEYYTADDSVIIRDFNRIFSVPPNNLKRLTVISLIYEKDHKEYFSALNDVDFMNELFNVTSLLESSSWL